MSEFGEPWHVELHKDAGDTDGIRICAIPVWGDLNPWIANCGAYSPEITEEHAMPGHMLRSEIAKRIIACVNFLAGVPTEDLQTIMENRPSFREKNAFDIGCVAVAINRGMLETKKSTPE